MHLIPRIFLTLCLAGAILPAQASAQDSDTSYAYIKEGQPTTFVGVQHNGAPDVTALRKQYAGNFIWFQQAGKTFIVRDPATLAKVEAAWAPTNRLSADMHQLDGQIREQSQAMTALGREMTASTRNAGAAHGEIEAIGKRMDAQGKTMDGLGKQMDSLGKQMDAVTKQADASSRNVLQLAVANGSAQRIPGK